MSCATWIAAVLRTAAGSRSQIDIHLELTMNLVQNSILAIEMPGFTRAYGPGVITVTSSSPCCSRSACIVRGEWRESNSTGALFLHVDHGVGYGDGSHCGLDIVVPLAAGMTLPINGLVEDERALLISTDSTNGIVILLPYN